MGSNIRSSLDFVSGLAALDFSNTFNPYRDLCPTHDLPTAARMRRENLKRVLDVALQQEEIGLWVGRDLGYRGGRRTGLALTDDVNLRNHGMMFGLDGLSSPTKGPIFVERTATTVWNMIKEINKPIFLWNVFPLHPHMPDQPMSNRSHTKAEALECRFLLDWLLKTLRPNKVVAIGRDAHKALANFNIDAIGARHPSYGGQTEFIQNIRAVYSIDLTKACGISAQGQLFS